MNRKTLKKRVIGSIPGWLFMLPTILGVGIFTIYPVTRSLYFSFFEYDLISVFEFVGLDNYKEVFLDPEMGKVIGNTFFFALINIPTCMIGSYLLALLLNVETPGIKFFRVLYYLPSVVPAIVGGIIWSYLMRTNVESPGLFNQMLMALGFERSLFFHAEDVSALASIVLMNIFGLGGGTITWLAQLKNIPRTIYEAAEIDGVKALSKFFYITLPMSTPMIFYNLITQLIVTLQFNGTLTFAPRGGRGNNNATYTFGLKIYHEAFRRYDMGYASALAWVLTFMIGLINILVFKTSKWVNYDV